MTIRWYGLLAPQETPTGDGRMFASSGLTYRDFPLRAAWQRVSGRGHDGAVVVGSWNGQYQGQGGVWGAGEFLDPTVVPEVIEAAYLLEKRLIGPSVDLDPRPLAYEVVEDPTSPGDTAIRITRGNVNGVTFVMAPAFSQVHITVDTEEEMTILAGAGISTATFTAFTVDSTSWSKFTLAPRETKFDFETAVANIAIWSGGDSAKFSSGFLWKDPDGDPNSRETYRLPIIDIFDGKPYLIPRAVFSAGVIMSGGHGGLYDVLNDQQRIEVQEVITDIYDMLREEYSDPRVIAPWQRGGRRDATSSASLMSWNRFQGTSAPSVMDASESTPSTAPTASASIAPSAASPVTTVRATATASTAGATFTNSGPVSQPTEKSSGPAGEMPTSSSPSTSGPSGVSTDSRPLTESPLSSTTNFSEDKEADVLFAEEEMTSTSRLIMSTERDVYAACSALIATEESDSSQTDQTAFGQQPTTLTAAGLLRPHSRLFADPKFTAYTGLQVTTDGKVFGHLAPWGQCHLGVGNKCTMLPRSATGYAYFKQGSVHTSDGKNLRVGKITMGTGHADERFGVIPAREHYDNTGACVAVVNAGEDSFGVWVAGALVAGVDEGKAAELRRSPLSGDWRRVNGNLELVGALAVNYPGFPILHEDADGQYSLIASGPFDPDGGVEQPVLASPGGDMMPRSFSDVDAFLDQRSRVERAASISRAFHDLLPPQEGCACDV